MTDIKVNVIDGYHPLMDTLIDALNQAQAGKGRERHQQGATPFMRQPICEIGRMVGLGSPAGQAIKKTQEALRLPTADRQINELLGAINYLAATIILIREREANEAAAIMGDKQA